MLVAQSPPDSAIVRALAPEAAMWQLPEQLLAEIVDTLHWLKWAKTEAGQQGRDHPKPVPRPGVDTDEPIGRKSDALPVDEMNDWLGW